MRDYVFYPFALCKPVARLSKAAKGRFGAAFARALPAALGNILVFTLVGVWHGATSNYILWGLYNISKNARGTLTCPPLSSCFSS